MTLIFFAAKKSNTEKKSNALMLFRFNYLFAEIKAVFAFLRTHFLSRGKKETFFKLKLWCVIKIYER